MLFTKVKQLYSNVLRNEKLARELRRTLRIFPSGVLVQTSKHEDAQKVCFSNHEFQEQIQDVKNNIDAVKNIRVEYTKAGAENTSTTNLHRYLRWQEAQVKENEILEQNRLQIT